MALFWDRECCLSEQVLQDLCRFPSQALLALKCPQQNGWVCSRLVLEEVPRRRWDMCVCVKAEGVVMTEPSGALLRHPSLFFFSSSR